jgi:leucine dehydrogenase
MTNDASSLIDIEKPKLVVDLSVNSKLKGFIVIHNDNLGPALGGTRIAAYKSAEEALKDALRLSHTMTYKCAIAGLPFGGGKGVIIADPKMSKKEILGEYAKQVDKLQGKFYTGEDVGLEEKDVQYMLKFSPYFIGKTGQAGDPSYFAALSTCDAIKIALDFLFKSSKIQGRKFAVKGAGKTGSFLAKLLAFAGGQVFIYDHDAKKVKQLMKTSKNIFEAKAKIEELDVDVFCPCALGHDITVDNVDKIKAKIVAGTANNQLTSLEVADALFKRGILYIPDYIANAGGLLDVADELMPGGYSRKHVLKSIDDLQITLKKVLQISKKQNVSPLRIAHEMAEKKFLKTTTFAV